MIHSAASMLCAAAAAIFCFLLLLRYDLKYGA